MSDDETESDSVGPDIDLEKLASESDSALPDRRETDGGDGQESDDGEDFTESEEHDEGHERGGDHDDHGHDHDDEPAGRTTAPQSDYSTRQVAIGALVTAIGIGIAYATPALLG